MAEIMPFRGIGYDRSRAGALEAVVSPPYDVIAPEEQEALYAVSDYNYVRVVLNRAEPGDEAGAQYVRAAGCLRAWLAAGVLREDAEPALYEYRQEFTSPADGKRYSRRGFFCALRLTPYHEGVVLPHEETRPKAKADRLELMRATNANPEPIYALYEDDRDYVARALEAALGDQPDDWSAKIGGDHHRVRRVTDADAIAAIARFLQPARIWIADGHHRYETALAYRDERRAAGAPDEPQPFDYILAVLSSFSDPGLVVLPTHRLVRNIAAGRLEELELQLERYFDLRPVAADQLAEAVREGNGHRIGVATAGGAWVATLRDEKVMDAAAPGYSPAWRRLDVSILHELVLERSLGIPAASVPSSPDVAYTRDASEALARVASGEFQAAFLLNDPTADEVRRVAAAGDKMPAKSTYFYPKLWSGLIARSVA